MQYLYLDGTSIFATRPKSGEILPRSECEAPAPTAEYRAMGALAGTAGRATRGRASASKHLRACGRGSALTGDARARAAAELPTARAYGTGGPRARMAARARRLPAVGRVRRRRPRWPHFIGRAPEDRGDLGEAVFCDARALLCARHNRLREPRSLGQLFLRQSRAPARISQSGHSRIVHRSWRYCNEMP